MHRNNSDIKQGEANVLYDGLSNKPIFSRLADLDLDAYLIRLEEALIKRVVALTYVISLTAQGLTAYQATHQGVVVPPYTSEPYDLVIISNNPRSVTLQQKTQLLKGVEDHLSASGAGSEIGNVQDSTLEYLTGLYGSYGLRFSGEEARIIVEDFLPQYLTLKSARDAPQYPSLPTSLFQSVLLGGGMGALFLSLATEKILKDTFGVDMDIHGTLIGTSIYLGHIYRKAWLNTQDKKEAIFNKANDALIHTFAERLMRLGWDIETYVEDRNRKDTHPK